MNVCIFGKFILLTVVAIHLMSVSSSSAASEGHDIWTHLFANNTYNKHVRPVKHWSTVTEVNIAIALIAILDLNEVKQTIAVTSRLILNWKDEYLQWKPADFGNISYMHIQQGHIWKPYIFLENSVTKQSELGTDCLEAIVKYDGSVEWAATEIFHTTCAADVRKFPFDTQKCSMTFEALGYSGDVLKIQSEHDHFKFHGFGGTVGWNIIETEIETQEYHGGDIHIICSLTLERDPMYFMLNIFLPIVLLSVINTCVFILPVQSGEKATFSITVFLALAVFLTIVSGNLPENSDSVSLLNVYVFISTLLSVLIGIVTVVQIRVFHRDPELPISAPLRRLTLACTSVKSLTAAAEKNQRNGAAKCAKKEFGNNIPNAEVASVMCNPSVEKNDKMTWPMVVKAFDNIFLVVFLIINFVMTMIILMMALKHEDLEDHHHDELGEHDHR